MAVKGIDVSHWNSSSAVENIIKVDKPDFLIAKATEGMTYVDRAYWNHINTAKQHGLLTGAYHYARPENNSAIDEAKNFLATIDARDDMRMLLALDWEGKALKCDPEWALTWLNYVYQHTGIRPLFYASQSSLKQFANIANAGYGLWVARYNSFLGEIQPWKYWAIWQFSSTPVDRNKFNGELSALYKYATPEIKADNGPGFKESLYKWLAQWEVEHGGMA